MNETVSRLSRRLQRHGYAVSPEKENGAYLASLGFEVATVIDVGVAAGTTHLYTAYPDAKFVLIEPIAEFERKVAKTWSETLDFDFHACGVGAEEGELTLRIPKIGARTLGTRATMAEFDDAGAAQISEMEERQVPVRTLDQVMAPYDGPFGLKIDTEGFEIEVIKGAAETLKRSSFVLAEVSVRRRYQDGYRFSDFVAAMAAHGFELHDFIRPPAPGATDCDAIFAPYDSPLFDYRDRRLARMAAKAAEG